MLIVTCVIAIFDALANYEPNTKLNGGLSASHFFLEFSLIDVG
jgi:hypothetical protein